MRCHLLEGTPDHFIKSLIHVLQHTYPLSSSWLSAAVNHKEVGIGIPHPGHVRQ